MPNTTRKVKQLSGACPVSVRHHPAVEKALDGQKFTLPVHPITLKQYYNLLAKSTIPKKLQDSIGHHGSTGTIKYGKLRMDGQVSLEADGTKAGGPANNDYINVTPQDVYTKLPLGSETDPYYLTIDKEGNVCFPGNANWELEQIANAEKAQEEMDRSDPQMVLQAADAMLKNNPSDNELSSYKTELENLLNNRNTSKRQMAKDQNFLYDPRYLIKSKVSGDGQTGGCMTIDAEDQKHRNDGLNPERKDVTGTKPVQSSLNLPLTHYEMTKTGEEYGHGRVPYQTGATAASVRCVPPSDTQFQKANPIMAALLRKTRTRKQNPENVRRGAIEYEHQDIAEHMAAAATCVNLPQPLCTSTVKFNELGTKIPFGNPHDSANKKMNDFCKFGPLPARPNDPPRCFPQKWDENGIKYSNYGNKLQDWFVEMVEPNYQEWANKHQPHTKIQLRTENMNKQKEAAILAEAAATLQQ